MTCVAAPAMIVGPAASAYVLPDVSVTLLIRAVESFQAMITTFRLPAVCAPRYDTLTLACADCGVAALICTNVGFGAAADVVADAVFEYGPGLLAASVARTR